ncbi:Core-2/I-Branching enzyme [Paracoccus aminovorans]|uniref:Peptide O-xylosyltransferase n=1 Tax=Paracoccus aminovorans TaxID=34004 RepID=A0A1I3B176_9RHOB|nr:beta-1,6-N-acetylglucosaminyltransferase [Paracoccus aminovorans]CQR85254.1 glycosyl transferase family protein [Paracoccus aminovorans]SFH55856.1 Core-2/I-Branching enzyme [Paracoccus aminovorans]
MTGDGDAIRLGVVMLCHDELSIAARMARVWADGGASVAIHVDAKAPAEAVEAMRRDLADRTQVLFSPRHSCEWGMFSLVKATQDAAALLLDRCPEVTHVLTVSGSCLPLRPVAELCAFLALHPRRDFIESVTAADVGWTVGGLNEERFTLRFPFSFRHRRKLFDRYVDLQRRLRFRRRIPQGLVPHLGSQWWCLTRTTLDAILTDPRRAEFDRYFARVWIPDESYFQTLARRHSLNIESRSLTLAKFDGQGKPYIFYDDHLEMLQQSRCFVARKIWRGAARLHAHFPQGDPTRPLADEPRPERLDRIISQAVARRNLGRPGLYMQSRFPLKDRENGKTSAPYAVLQGFSDLFPGFEDWLSDRVDADVHGHLFAVHGAEFAGRRPIGPGGLSDGAALRDMDPRGFLANLIRISRRMQVWQFSPRDGQEMNWFTATDPNARIFVVTGAWAVPLLHSDMPFDDIRRVAAILQRTELAQMQVLNSVWLKAQTQVWDLGDFCARPAAVLRGVLRQLGGDPETAATLPPMREIAGMGRFLQRLRNAGLRPQLMGDFPATDTDPSVPPQERPAP